MRQQACGSKTKNHSKIHRWQVRSSFAGAEMRPDKKRPAENTCRIVKGLDAVWAHFCPSKPCLPLSIDGSEREPSGFPFAFNHPPQRPKSQNKILFLFCDFASQLVKKVRSDFFDKLRGSSGSLFLYTLCMPRLPLPTTKARPAGARSCLFRYRSFMPEYLLLQRENAG